jgi:acetyl esterase/lipase
MGAGQDKPKASGTNSFNSASSRDNNSAASSAIAREAPAPPAVAQPPAPETKTPAPPPVVVSEQSAQTESQSWKVKAVRARDKKVVADHLDRILEGNDSLHEGIFASGVTVQKIEPQEPKEEWEPGQNAWNKWVDEKKGVTRGGAHVYAPEEGWRPDVCALFIHGGAFECYSPDTGGYDQFASRIAAEMEMIVVCPDHPLSGEGRSHKAKAIIASLVEDALALIQYHPIPDKETGFFKAREKLANVIILGDSSGATQATSVLLEIARTHDSYLENVKGIGLLSPWWDLSCGGPTYISNAFSEDTHTGDVPFRDPPDENRASFRSYASRYLGSDDLMQDVVYSPYWLCRESLSEDDAALLAKLAKARVPVWACIGAAETLMGEVLDFAQRLQGKFPIEIWLHDAMFHDWPLYTSGDGFPSKEKAFENLRDFMNRASESAFEEKPLIQYYIDPWVCKVSEA